MRGTLDADSMIEGRVAIGPGTVVERSRLRGPLVIGANARIVDAYVGPFTAIADGVQLSHCEIEHSIVLERATIHDVPRRIESSLIGRRWSCARATRGPHPPVDARRLEPGRAVLTRFAMSGRALGS